MCSAWESLLLSGYAPAFGRVVPPSGGLYAGAEAPAYLRGGSRFARMNPHLRSEMWGTRHPTTEPYANGACIALCNPRNWPAIKRTQSAVFWGVGDLAEEKESKSEDEQNDCYHPPTIPILLYYLPNALMLSRMSRHLKCRQSGCIILFAAFFPLSAFKAVTAPAKDGRDEWARAHFLFALKSALGARQTGTRHW